MPTVENDLSRGAPSSKPVKSRKVLYQRLPSKIETKKNVSPHVAKEHRKKQPKIKEGFGETILAILGGVCLEPRRDFDLRVVLAIFSRFPDRTIHGLNGAFYQALTKETDETKRQELEYARAAMARVTRGFKVSRYLEAIESAILVLSGVSTDDEDRRLV